MAGPRKPTSARKPPGDYAEFRGDRAIADGLLQRAQGWLDGLDVSPDHAWLAAINAHEALLAGKDPARAAALAVEALQLARAAGSPDVAVVDAGARRPRARD